MCVRRGESEKLFSSCCVLRCQPNRVSLNSHLILPDIPPYFVNSNVVYENRNFKELLVSKATRRAEREKRFWKIFKEASTRRGVVKGGGNEIENENCLFVQHEFGSGCKTRRNETHPIFHRFVPMRLVCTYNDRRLVFFISLFC